MVERKGTSRNLKINSIVYIGDLIHIHPNSLKDYMPRLFKCLQSPSKDIRRTVVTVLSHLILNDYVKIKNEIVDFLYLVKDSENEIQVLVQIFFHQLNEKNKNAIQNVIPEAVTRLSSLDEEGGVSDIMFEELSRFLLGFIFKETDSELLIDKFIKRL